MDFKYQIGETTYMKTMPKSTKIRMLRNTSTNTCHEVNLFRNYCLWYIYLIPIPTVLRSNIEF